MYNIYFYNLQVNDVTTLDFDFILQVLKTRKALGTYLIVRIKIH